MPSLKFSAQDRFAVADIATAELAPHPFTMGLLSDSAAGLSDWQMIWDLRTLDGSVVYEDILDAFDEAISYEEAAPIVYASPEQAPIIEGALSRFRGRAFPPRVLPTRNKPLPKRALNLAPFTDDWSGSIEGTGLTPLLDPEGDFNVDQFRTALRDDGQIATEIGLLPSVRAAEDIVEELLRDEAFLDGYAKVMDDLRTERGQLLSKFLESIASQSLLSEIALTFEAGQIQVLPLHAGALVDVEGDSELLTVRPARRGSGTQWRCFAAAIAELEQVLNDPDADEAAIEDLLVRNPLFLRGLNYTQAYHQVVLPLEGGRYFKPDIIAEPAGSEWWDIIDIKLPKEPIFVGRPGRVGMSMAIRDAASQLREYARWFDGSSVAKKVEDRYGIRCHEPKQVVIIGRDPQEFTEEQRRAAKSTYPDLEIVTYDGLLKAARSRLLF